MGKVLKVVATVVGVAALVIPGVGSVIGSALISVGVGAGVATAIVAGLGMAAFSAGLKSLAGAIGLGPKPPQVSAASTDRLQANVNTRASRKIVFGRTAANTDVHYQEFTGTNQDTLNTIVTLASHALESIDEVWFDDKLAWSSSSGVGAAFAGFLAVTTRSEGTTANAFTITGSSSWTASASRMVGNAYVWLRYTLSGNNSPFASAISSRMTFRVRGAKLYDPRRDSTRGGSGSHRADNQATWQWVSDDVGRNPALQLLWYLLGWRIQNPVTSQWKLAVGLGLPVDRINIASFMAAANICDEPVTLAAGGTEPRYRSDGVFGEDDDPKVVFDNLCAAMNGVLRDDGGQLALSILTNDLGAPVADFTEADVVEGFTWLQTPPIDQTFNIVRGQYIDASDAGLYQPVDYPDVVLTSPDGIDRSKTFSFALVQSASQAQRLAKTYLQRAQYPGTFSADFLASAWRCQVGSVVRLTFPALGFSNKLFRVVEHSIRTDGRCPMVLREENAAIYAWSASEAPAVTAAAPISYNPLNDPLRTGIADAAKTALWPNITGTGKPADNADVTGANIAAGVVGQSAWATYAALTPQQVAQLVPNMVYNPTGVLGLDRWVVSDGSISAQKGAYGEGYYFWANSGSNLAPVGFYQDVPIAAGQAYTLSADIYAYNITVSSGSAQARVYIQWLNGSGAHISYSAVAGLGAGNSWTHVSTLGQVAPAGAVTARVRCDTWGSGAYSLTSVAWSKIKLQLGSVDTLFTDDATYGARYVSGVSIEALKPAEANANVTETRVAAAISAQGDLATANRASLPFGQNAFANSDMTTTAVGWEFVPGNNASLGGSGGRNAVTGYFGRRNVAHTAIFASGAIANTTYLFGPSMKGFWAGGATDVRRFGLPVKAGDRVYLGGKFAVHGGSTILVRARFFNESGTLLNEQDASWNIGNGRAGGPTGAAGEPTNFSEQGAYFTVPSGAFFALLGCFTYSAGTDTSVYIFMTEPIIARVPAGQNATFNYVPGLPDKAVDVTSENVAAAIVGQGTGATASTLAGMDPTAAAQLSALTAGSTYVAAVGSSFQMFLTPGQSVALSGRFATYAGGSSSGSLTCLLQARVVGGSYSTFATGTTVSIGPTEPGSSTASGTFTNSTGAAQVFEFTVDATITPGTAGGGADPAKSYIKV